MNPFRALAGIMVVLATVQCRSQDQYPPCPDGYINPGRLARTCLRSLPWSGMVWMRGADGQPCSCDCPDRSTTTIAQLALARSERFDRFQKAQLIHPGILPWQKMAKATVLRMSGAPITASSCTVGPAGVENILPLNVAELCDDFDVLLHVLRKLQAAGITPDFIVVITSDNSTHSHFPSHGFIDGTHYINLPPVFLRSPEVGVELLEFMLLHELGHGYNPNSDECLADQFAAEVGMRTLYPGPALIFTLETAMDQLLAYHRAIAGDPNLDPTASATTPGLATCSSIGRYPRYTCRKQAVLFMEECYAGQVERPNCPTVYAPDCWVHQSTGGGVTPTATMCMPPNPCPAPKGSENAELYDQLLLVDALQHGMPLQEICTKYPQICDERRSMISPVQLGRGFPTPASKHGRRIKRVLDHMLEQEMKDR